MTEPAIRYLRYLAGAFIGFLTLFVGFNVLVDPYRLIDLVDIPGFNAMKPMAHDREEMSKPYAELRAAPTTVLIGSSRANGSLDPDVLEHLPGPKNIYNFSISAFGLYEEERFLQHALAAGGVKTVVWTLEFSEFLDSRQPPKPVPQPIITLDRLLVDRDGQPNRQRFLAELADFGTAFLTLDALTASVRTVLSQDPANGTETARGWLIKDQMREVQQEGNHMLFLEKTRSNAAVTARFAKQLFIIDDAKGSFAEFNRIMAECREHGVELKVILPPFHAYLLELYRENGLWPVLEDWKRAIAAVAATANRLNPAAPQVEIWDFADYDQWTMDPVPPPADHRPMPWYWDMSHYRPTLGELMWRRIFDPAAAGELADLGDRLDPATIEPRLAAIRARQERAMSDIDRDVRAILGGATPSHALDAEDLSGETERN